MEEYLDERLYHGRDSIILIPYSNHDVGMDVETAPPGAGSRSKRFRLPTRVSGWLQLCTESLNFYRVHVIYFTLVSDGVLPQINR